MVSVSVWRLSLFGRFVYVSRSIGFDGYEYYHQDFAASIPVEVFIA